MARYLLDTNIISFMVADDPQVTARTQALRPGDSLCTSVVVVGEMLFGLERMSPGRRQRDFARRVSDVLSRIPSLPVPEDAGGTYATFKYQVRRVGTPLEDNDLWIPASAYSHGCVLVSADSDMARLQGITLENWAT